MKLNLVAIVLLVGIVQGIVQPVFGQSGSSPDTEAVVVEPILQAVAFRPWIVTAHYSLLDLLVPNKVGLAVERRDSARSSWAFEFSHGSFSPFFVKDLGSFSEDRFSLIRRHSGEGGAGFQFFYGAFYQKFKLAVGGELLNRITSGYYPYADVVSIDGIGAMAGIGYRWMIQGRFVIALDGIAWSQPFVTTSKNNRFSEVATNQSDRDDIDTAAKLIEYFPRFAVAKIAFGYAF